MWSVRRSAGLSKALPQCPAVSGGGSGESWEIVDMSGGTDLAGNTYDIASSSWGAETFDIYGTQNTHGRADGGRDAGGRFVLEGSAFDYTLYDGVIYRLTWAAWEYWTGSAWAAMAPGTTDSGFGVVLTNNASFAGTGFWASVTAIGTEQRLECGQVGDASLHATGNPGSGPQSGTDGLEARFDFAGDNRVAGVYGSMNKSSATLYRGRGHNQEFQNTAMTNLHVGVFCDHDYTHNHTKQRLTGAQLQRLWISPYGA